MSSGPDSDGRDDIAVANLQKHLEPSETGVRKYEGKGAGSVKRHQSYLQITESYSSGPVAFLLCSTPGC